MPFFIQCHKICNDLILKVQNLRISPENTPKTMKKIFNKDNSIEHNINNLESEEINIVEIKDIIIFIESNLKRGIASYNNG